MSHIRLSETCIEKDCEEPTAGPDDPIPGTGRKGSAYWCVRHEAEQVVRITKRLKDLIDISPFGDWWIALYITV